LITGLFFSIICGKILYEEVILVALFYTFEILKQRRPRSLGKALDSEAGKGWA
jgi:hypothetical protein